jgi:hypothetical protein
MLLVPSATQELRSGFTPIYATSVTSHPEKGLEPSLRSAATGAPLRMFEKYALEYTLMAAEDSRQR